MNTLAVGLAPASAADRSRIELLGFLRGDPADALRLAERLAGSLNPTAEDHGLYLHPASVANEAKALAALADDGPATVIIASPDLIEDCPEKGKRAALPGERLAPPPRSTASRSS